MNVFVNRAEEFLSPSVTYTNIYHFSIKASLNTMGRSRLLTLHHKHSLIEPQRLSRSTRLPPASLYPALATGGAVSCGDCQPLLSIITLLYEPRLTERDHSRRPDHFRSQLRLSFLRLSPCWASVSSGSPHRPLADAPLLLLSLVYPQRLPLSYVGAA